MSSPVPAMSPALIAYLRELYPDRCPTPDMSERAVWMAAGAAGVVRKLEADLEDQAANRLGGHFRE